MMAGPNRRNSWTDQRDGRLPSPSGAGFSGTSERSVRTGGFETERSSERARRLRRASAKPPNMRSTPSEGARKSLGRRECLDIVRRDLLECDLDSSFGATGSEHTEPPAGVPLTLSPMDLVRSVYINSNSLASFSQHENDLRRLALCVYPREVFRPQAVGTEGSQGKVELASERELPQNGPGRRLLTESPVEFRRIRIGLRQRPEQHAAVFALCSGRESVECLLLQLDATLGILDPFLNELVELSEAPVVRIGAPDLRSGLARRERRFSGHAIGVSHPRAWIGNIGLRAQWPSFEISKKKRATRMSIPVWREARALP